MEREAFLARARARGRLPAAPAEDPGPVVPDLPIRDLVSRFCAELEKVDGVAHHATDPEDAYRIVADLMQGRHSFMAREPLPVPGLAARLIGDGFTIVNPDVPTDRHARIGHQLRYEDLDVGITDAVAGLAESGSIVVTAERGRPRMASLIPLAHIALLPTGRLFPSLTHFLTAESGQVTASSNLVVITGPSRTGDIEHRLTLGVHGPRHLHVVLLPTA